MARRRKMDPERKAFISSLLEHYQPNNQRMPGRPGHAERPARRNAARYVRS